MLTPTFTQPRWVCWATAVSLLLIQGTVLQPKPGKLRATAPHIALAGSRPSIAMASHAGRPSWSQLAELRANTSLVFVAGPNGDVRFRVDLRNGTVATPRHERVLDRVVDVVLSERAVFLCQAPRRPGAPADIMGFDLRTGQNVEAALATAGAASIAPHFCATRRSPATRTWEADRSRYSTALQMSLERQATILPSVSNGDLQSSFLTSSRHSLSSLTTTPPGQS